MISLLSATTFKDVMITIGGIAIAIVILLVMITIHELGHYAAGRKLGFKINEFAVGFGPKLLSKKNKHGTAISLRALPLGGFCAFEGEDEDKPDNPDAFNSQKPWKRMVVLAMGAIFNILSAVIFSFIVLLAVGDIYTATGIQVAKVYNLQDKYDKVTITAKAENPNYDIDGVNGLKEGDIFITVNGQDIEGMKNLSAAAFSNIIKEAPEEFIVVIRREGQEQQLEVKKWTYTYLEEGQDAVGAPENVGLGISMYGLYKNDYNVLTALRDCVPYTFKLAGMVLSALGQLFTTSTGLRQMGGTVTTIAVMGKVATTSLQGTLLLLPLIAVNLGVFNLLPIPALDGSKIIICAIEWIRRKPLNRKVEGWIHAVGFILLIGFVIVADILQLFVFKQF